MELHPYIIEKEGKKEFVVLPYEEFLVLEEAINDYEDLRDLREEKERSNNQPGVPIDKVISELACDSDFNLKDSIDEKISRSTEH